jgi:hypothetical protein
MNFIIKNSIAIKKFIIHIFNIYNKNNIYIALTYIAIAKVFMSFLREFSFMDSKSKSESKSKSKSNSESEYKSVSNSRNINNNKKKVKFNNSILKKFIMNIYNMFDNILYYIDKNKAILVKLYLLNLLIMFAYEISNNPDNLIKNIFEIFDSKNFLKNLYDKTNKADKIDKIINKVVVNNNNNPFSNLTSNLEDKIKASKDMFFNIVSQKNLF